MSESPEEENLENVDEPNSKSDAENREIDTVNEDNDKNENTKESDKKKTKTCRQKKKWNCENQPLWRVYMNSYIAQEERLEKQDKLDQRKAAVLPKFPNVKSYEQIPPPGFYSCFPFNTFNLTDRARLPDKLNLKEKVRLWKRLKNDPELDIIGILPEIPPDISRTDSEKWPATWPCTKRDLDGEKRQLEMKMNRTRKGLLPCEEDSDEETIVYEPRDNFADRKELGHARIPVTCSSLKKRLLVDRAVGDQPGLVDGDFIVFLFGSRDDEKGNRTYADVCLRGLKGMHLQELSNKRVREKTWKFCFYQAIVALLAKTQLRYKFAWSANIDYIYDHAWMLFVHMGSINVKERIRFDDVVVYNYKYSVELELVHEMKNAPRLTANRENYVERDLTMMLELERPELMKTKDEIGWEKSKHPKPPPVHKQTQKIEAWFDKLPDNYRNCVFRTDKFSLAFWKDGTFWYLYNPYRCDEFGFWFNQGYACILKFCTRISLKRHLMILLIRAYSYQHQSPLKRSTSPVIQGSEKDSSDEENDESSTDSEETDGKSSNDDTFTIQIYQMIYHCAQIENVKLLQKRPPGPRTERMKKKETDECGFDPFMSYDPCSQDRFSGDLAEPDDEEVETMEKPHWLKNFKVTWARFSISKKKNNQDDAQISKLRWHQFYVEEPYKIFSLWGQIHPTEQIFAKENRGKQINACYVVCAGMTRIQAPEYWSSKTLDAIVMCGDRFYTLSKIESERAIKTQEISHATCWNNYLSKHFKIGETMFEGNVLPPICGQLYNNKVKCLWASVEEMFLKHHFGILTCESSCLGIFKFCGAYYMFDAHSIGPPLFQYGNGVAYLIRATSFFKFMTVLVLTIGSNECSRFSLRPIEIGKVIDLGTMDVQGEKKKQKLRRTECHHEEAGKSLKKSKAKCSDERNESIHTGFGKKSGCGN